MTDPNALLMGSGVPAIKPTEKNVPIRIDRITAIEATQQTDFKTREPLTYKDGNPIMQIIVTGQTSERNPDNPDDDGIRRLFINKVQMRQAVKQAVVDAGASGLEIGGALAVVWYDDKPSETAGLSPQKLHRAQYQRSTESPSAQTAPSADLFAPAADGADLL